MTDIDVLEYSLHRVDLQEVGPVLLAVDGSASGLKKYAERVLKELFESSRARYFRFQSMGELVASSLVDILDGGDWGDKSSEIAKKLYDVEVDVQERVDKLGTKVRRGGLLQIKIKHEGKVKFVITKIDDDDFFDETELELKSGLPASKARLQKTAVAAFSDEKVCEELILSDSKPTISEYWYRYFLVAAQLTDSETNTKNAFQSIERLLNREVKKVSSVDYWFLRNEIVGHFRNEESLAFDDLVEKVAKHKPESEVFKDKFPGFLDAFRNLPKSSSKPFETQFDIAPGVIKAKIIKKIFLDQNFELRISGEVEDLRTKISADEDSKGKFVKIYSDAGYEEFKSRDPRSGG
ncbi:hypothetical protein HNO53_05220 [Billgrantia antri]|uniref:Uncharacterized protein n=1 Tax=Halomonas sulfidivorans TaxID=2733488 RepID=A0ABX7WDU1_9GAMM|nr:nucleoid-associated protein [Halomonas sulfidivorans]QTP58171.1 hypothetical protein HNO53_05220 [Halomonas sulfidivorans]